MPAINIPMLVDIGLPLVLFHAGANDIDLATPVDTTIIPGKFSTGLPSLDGRYFLNQNNAEISGYLYIPQPYTLNTSNVYIYNDNGQNWGPYLNTAATFALEASPATKNGLTYNVYKFGENDEDWGWIATTVNVSFTLAQNI